MQSEYLSLIKENYPFEIINVDIAPRGLVAETYVLNCKNNDKYFCKVIKSTFFIPEVIKSLPVMYEMHKKGINRINYPIKTSKGELYIFHKETLIVISNYIEAKQAEDYSKEEFGKLLGEIHSITPKIDVIIPKEDFIFSKKVEFEKYFEDSLNIKSNDSIINSLQKIILKYEKEIRTYYAEYLKVSEICRNSDLEMVITHGDAPGNVLVSTTNQLYLIDWDEILLGPAEQDLWMLDNDENFIRGYKNIRKEFSLNKDARSFYIYKYYFRCLVILLGWILDNERSKELRLADLDNLEHQTLEGFMKPKLREISEFKY